jgi:polyisoprenyl-teichoic acid--peptidoglycan teichoic acid transferase
MLLLRRFFCGSKTRVSFPNPSAPKQPNNNNQPTLKKISKPSSKLSKHPRKPSKPSEPSKPSGKSGKLRWVGLAIALSGVAFLSATVGAFVAMTMASTPLMQRKLSPAEAAVFAKGNLSTVNSLQLPELNRPVNILVLGAKVLTNDVGNVSPEQQRLGYHALVNSFDGLTDTMMLIRFNPETKKVVLLSIPRDTQIDIPGYGVGKINEANANGGPALSAKTVSQLLGGVGVDRYVTINVQGVQALVDALGGVTVTVPKDMKYQDDSQHLYVNLKAGKQHLNGEKALQLLRFRSDEAGDIGRVQRQQMVIRALTEQALNPGTIARMPQILSAIRSHIDTNLTVEELVAVVNFANQVEKNDRQTLIVPGDYGEVESYGTSYWLPAADRIQTMMARYFGVEKTAQSAENSNPSNVRIILQDSTRRAAPNYLAAQLERGGYTNVIVSDPVGEMLPTTRIVAQQGDATSAQAIQQLLGFGEVRVDTSGELDSDVTIQLGQDWLQRQSQRMNRTSRKL